MTNFSKKRTVSQAGGANASSIVSQTITNGVTNKAPSEDAVFDALAPLLVSSKIFMYRNFK